jgi:hypothetical protein
MFDVTLSNFQYYGQYANTENITQQDQRKNVYITGKRLH